MKAGMIVIQTRQVNNRWILLCGTQDSGEWATYVSPLPDTSYTEHGHYFPKYSTAVADFNKRVNQHR